MDGGFDDRPTGKGFGTEAFHRRLCQTKISFIFTAKIDQMWRNMMNIYLNASRPYMSEGRYRITRCMHGIVGMLVELSIQKFGHFPTIRWWFCASLLAYLCKENLEHALWLRIRPLHCCVRTKSLCRLAQQFFCHRGFPQPSISIVLQYNFQYVSLLMSMKQIRALWDLGNPF